jgi:hypothetical protein
LIPLEELGHIEGAISIIIAIPRRKFTLEAIKGSWVKRFLYRQTQLFLISLGSDWG